MTDSPALTVFMSYSHVDEALRAELAKHLSALRRQGVVKLWHDREIHAGAELDPEIRRNLDTSDIILLLISADFINSDYCYGVELRGAMERHRAGAARVIPVILRPCDWQPVLGQLLATPADGKPISSFANKDEGFLQVAQAIRRVAEEMARKGAPPSRPVAAASTGVSPSSPAPSRLKVRRTFTDRDRAKFLVEAFNATLDHFRTSAAAAEAGNPGLEIEVRQIDADHFTAVGYVDGREAATCKIWHSPGDRGGGQIRFSYELDRGGNSWNEWISVKDQPDQIVLEPGGMQFQARPESKELGPQQAAEYLWRLFADRLSR